MKSLKTSLMLSVAVTGFGVAAMPTAAAAAAEEDAPIIVTARRVEERLQDVPISITVYNQQQLAERNVVDANDLATYTPSLSSTNRYGPDKATFAIRGFTQDGLTAPTVGVYLADVAAPRAAGAIAGGGGTGPGSFFDLENVQVLKGPQGTLQGRNTTGGAILLVPTKPTHNLEGFVEGTYGTYNQRRLQGVLNVPLSDTVRIRIGADRNLRDGYLKNHSGIGPADYGDINYTALRLSIVADLTPDLENYTIGYFNKSNTHGIAQRLIACNPNATGLTSSFLGTLACAQLDRQAARGDGFWDVEGNASDPFVNVKQWGVINTTTWKASDNLTVKNIMAYQRYIEDANVTNWGENFAAGKNVSLPNVFPNGIPDFFYVQIGKSPDHHNMAQGAFSEEFQLQGNSADGRLTWQAGFYMEVSRPVEGGSITETQIFNNCSDLATFACTPVVVPLTLSPTLTIQYPLGSVSVTDKQSYFDTRAIYAQGTYDFTDQLSLTLGFRYTWDKVRQNDQSVQVQFPAAAPYTPKFVCNSDRSTVVQSRSECFLPYTQNSSKPTWLIDFDYKPNSDMLFYAKWARGYRQGGISGNAPAGFQTWQPEKVDLYEIGAKTSFRGAIRGTFNIAAFYNDFVNQQVTTSLSFAPGQGVGGVTIINAGSSRIYGIETDFMIEPTDGLELSGSYAYLNTKVNELKFPGQLPSHVIGINFTNIEGGRLIFTPEHRFSGTVKYTLPLPRTVGKVSASATYTYTSNQYATYGSPYGLLPSSSLLNLNLEWKEVMGSSFDLALFMTNVTNEETPLAVDNAYVTAGFEGVVTNVPRMFGARVRFHFGP